MHAAEASKSVKSYGKIDNSLSKKKRRKNISLEIGLILVDILPFVIIFIF